jgi:cytochrome c biogenesis protein CcdA
VGQLLFGTTLLASFLGGVVALLAPCCVSVMLPAYFATGFGRRSGIVAGTLVFAAGVGTVIVPIGLGASAVSAAVSAHHLVVFLVGGAAMVAGGLAMLAGWKPMLPMPAAGPTGHGVAATYGLGLFSGIASACCAPVLAGVAVLSGATQSFLAALAIGLTYVAGMVAPLVILALVWDRRDWGSSRLLHGRDVRLRLGGFSRRIALGSLLSGVLLAGMGALTIVTAFTGPSMPTSGWRVSFAANLQHIASRVTHALAWLPGWAIAIALAGTAAYLVWHVRHNHAGGNAAPPDLASPPTTDRDDGAVSAQGAGLDQVDSQEVVSHDR